MKLTIELVPSTCWYVNVRSNVSEGQWEICKRYVRKRSGSRCEICGGRGPRWPVECHEIWHYDDVNRIQRLEGLIALCPSCHEVKHIGRAAIIGTQDRALQHLMKVNGISRIEAELYLEHAYEVWMYRSTMEWELDISFLETLGIPVGTSQR